MHFLKKCCHIATNDDKHSLDFTHESSNKTIVFKKRHQLGTTQQLNIFADPLVYKQKTQNQYLTLHDDERRKYISSDWKGFLQFQQLTEQEALISLEKRDLKR